jgi:hypothetical protein
MVIPLPKAPMPIPPDLGLAFPADLCCNCSAIADLTILEQDTRLTRYFLIGGSEVAFRLRLPFCRVCGPSVNRRPVSLLHKLLVFGLFYFAVFAVLMLCGMALDSESLLDYTVLLSGVFGLVITVLWYAARRPERGQSSYYQPVRITRLSQKFLSGAFRVIGFGFTNYAYLHRFESLNAQAITAGRVQAKKL